MVGVSAVEQQQGAELAVEIQMHMTSWIKSARSHNEFPNKMGLGVDVDVKQQEQNYIAHHVVDISQLQQHQPLKESRGC